MTDHIFTVGQKVLYRDWGWVAGETGREWGIIWREVEIVKINSVKFRIRFQGGEEQLAHVKNLKPLPATTAIIPISERMTLREATFRRIERTVWEYGQQLPDELQDDFSDDELTIIIPSLMKCVGLEPGEDKNTDKAAIIGTRATFEIELRRKWLIERQEDMRRVHTQIDWLLKQFPPLEHSDFELVEFYRRELQRLEAMELWCYIYIQYLSKPRKMRDWSWLPIHQDRLQPHTDAMLKRLNVILDACFRSTKTPETQLKAMMVGDEIHRWNPHAIVPAGERRTLIDVCWNAPNPVFFYPQINVGDTVLIIEMKETGVVRWIESADGHELYAVGNKHGSTRYMRRAISLCIYYEGTEFMPLDWIPFSEGDFVELDFHDGPQFGYFERYETPHWVSVKMLDGTSRGTHLQRLSHAKPEQPPQPLTPEKTLTEQSKRPLKKGDRVRVLVGGYKGKIGIVDMARHYKDDPARSYCSVNWDDGAPQSAYKFHMLELVEDEPVKNQPQIMAENMPDDWMAPTMRAMLGPDPVHGLNDHKRFFPNTPIEPLPINCAECGKPVGLETVVFNKKTYCMDCGEPKLHEEQDETLFLQKLSDAPDEDTPAPRVIEQPPQPEIPMKQLSLFGD
jgi:hypothetical protein